MKLQFRNTLTREVEAVRPLTEGRLGIYVCGPTVYAAPHLGHARSAVVFDVFRRCFEALGCEVTLVRNITDIDDKILLRARAEGKDYRSIADRCRREYDDAMRALNVRPPDAAPRATAFIPACQKVIARIHHHGHAYRKGGSVYFDTRSCPAYGRLSARSAARNRPGGTPSGHPDKRHPDDFALWKERKDGEPFWESPWGPGRPGWHIECTAMSHALLGTPFDIHGGGCDLIFPHHENEIAQSMAAFGRPPAKSWIHHGMVTVADARMAKSRGNAPSLQGLLRSWHPEAVRLFLLSRHYRSDLPFTADGLHMAADFLYLSRQVLGLLQTPLEDYAGQRRIARRPLPRPVIDHLVARRRAARQTADWRTAAVCKASWRNMGFGCATGTAPPFGAGRAGGAGTTPAEGLAWANNRRVCSKKGTAIRAAFPNGFPMGASLCCPPVPIRRSPNAEAQAHAGPEHCSPEPP